MLQLLVQGSKGASSPLYGDQENRTARTETPGRGRARVSCPSLRPRTTLLTTDYGILRPASPFCFLGPAGKETGLSETAGPWRVTGGGRAFRLERAAAGRTRTRKRPVGSPSRVVSITWVHSALRAATRRAQPLGVGEGRLGQRRRNPAPRAAPRQAHRRTEDHRAAVLGNLVGSVVAENKLLSQHVA